MGHPPPLQKKKKKLCEHFNKKQKPSLKGKGSYINTVIVKKSGKMRFKMSWNLPKLLLDLYTTKYQYFPE